MAWRTTHVHMTGSKVEWPVPNGVTAISLMANGADTTVAFNGNDDGFTIRNGYSLNIEDLNLANVTLRLVGVSGQLDILYADHLLE